ncbi:hypothetical protein MTP03_19660 [Tsukamurella sp. PLM1]|nr:hypothetical protein MTP03_19660 [Tsukamurella sp. PLM1]
MAAAIADVPGGERAEHGVAEQFARRLRRREAGADGRQPLGRQVQRVRTQLEPRNSEQLGGHAAARGENVGDHQVGAELLDAGEHSGPDVRRSGVDLGAGVLVVVAGTGGQAREFAGVDAVSGAGLDPPAPGEHGGLVAGGDQAESERETGQRVPGLGSGYQRDAHPHSPRAGDPAIRRWWSTSCSSRAT